MTVQKIQLILLSKLKTRHMTVQAGLALRRITEPFNRFKITRVSPKNSLTLAGWFTETARQAGQQMTGWLLRC